MENLLPAEIISEILSRLPTESVLQCRRVCKTWRTLLQHPYFAHMHLHRLLQLDDHKYHNHSNVAAKGGLSFLFGMFYDEEGGKQLHYGEYEGKSYKTLRRINQPLINMRYKIVGSCNGLICICENKQRSGIYEPLYICNPINREYVNLPRLNINNENKVERMVCGFGYHPSLNEYKVVRIYYSLDQPLGRVHVYTLGSGSQWRDIGEITYSLRHCSWNEQFLPFPVSIFVNGAVHWLDHEEKIVAFDLADEVFHLLPSPPCVLSVFEYFQLRVLGGCLCVLHYMDHGKVVAIWLLKKNKESSGYDMNEEYRSWSWSKEFTIRIGRTAYPFALTNSGEVLLWYDSLATLSRNKSILCRYDPKTAALEKLVDNHTGFLIWEATLHMSSLVSLKALGEKCRLRCRLRKRYLDNPTLNPNDVKQQRKDKEEVNTDNT
ncbi:F-box domain [Macleaya cordata]|uniref:F-box domain n=1 Tax=Macleaya cordata TaxID=56857 RepID=A0A200QBU3_MACCD|nr:F-box domain [Macleaya cordata]